MAECLLQFVWRDRCALRLSVGETPACLPECSLDVSRFARARATLGNFLRVSAELASAAYESLQKLLRIIMHARIKCGRCVSRLRMNVLRKAKATTIRVGM